LRVAFERDVKLLMHRREWGGEDATTSSLGARTPPQGLLF
jgi:hypothetical protein